MRTRFPAFFSARVGLLAMAGLTGLSGLTARAQLTFDFTTTGSVPQSVIDGFTAAGQLWSASISDSVTVNIQIGYSSLGGSTLGSASSTQFYIPYSTYRSALVTKSTSSYDTAALASLPSASSYDLSYNYLKSGETAASPTAASGSSNTVLVNQATLRALNISAAFTPFDASITFSSDFSFDFDRSDGIGSGTYDFVGIAAHEIGHALGFSSIGDYIDQVALTTPRDVSDVEPAALDLFRYTAVGTRDISVGVAAYLSLDGGVTSLGSMSTGVNTGDGRQTSHWKDNQALGLMDPTLSPTELGTISTADLKALDIIGWSVSQFSAVPEPSSYGVMLGMFAFGVAGLRRRPSR